MLSLCRGRFETRPYRINIRLLLEIFKNLNCYVVIYSIVSAGQESVCLPEADVSQILNPVFVEYHSAVKISTAFIYPISW